MLGTLLANACVGIAQAFSVVAARHTTDFSEKLVVASHCAYIYICTYVCSANIRERARDTDIGRERERDTERGSARESEGD